MRHRHTGPSLRARHRSTARAHRRNGRPGLFLAVLALVTGFVLAAPVVSGPAAVAERVRDSPVVMGLDGRLTSAAFASASARLSMGSDGERGEASASRSERAAVFVAPESPDPPAAEAPAPGPAPAPEDAAPGPPAPKAVPAPAAPAAPKASAAPEAPAAPEALPAPDTSPAPRAPQAAASAPPLPAAAPATSDRAGRVLALVNRERAASGCRPVTADAGLAGVAGAHSADMRDRGFFDHVNLAGLSPFDRAEAAGESARAENIARGQADPAAVMDAWMSSPGHRANILDCSLTRLGVGIADGGGGPWWTQLFG